MPAYFVLTTDDTDPSIPHLCSFEGCPFAQTTRIVLAHKRIRFRHSEVRVFNETATAMAEKPDWFLALSPRGRVPILEHHGRVLYESAVIDEYLEEIYPAPALLPEDPWRRGIARIWLRNASVTLPKLWYRALTATDAALEAQRARLVEFFVELGEALEEHGGEGPWLFGDAYSLVDVFLTPFYERFDAVNRHYGKFELPRPDTDSPLWSGTSAEVLDRLDDDDWRSLARVQSHWQAALRHPSYLATRLDPDWLVRLYRPFVAEEAWISAENNAAVRDIVE